MSVGEKVDEAVETAKDKLEPAKKAVNKWRRGAAKSWERAHPFVKLAALGAAFAGGGLLIGRFFGPPVARRIGDGAGEGFARGVNNFRAQLERGSRFG